MRWFSFALLVALGWTLGGCQPASEVIPRDGQSPSGPPATVLAKPGDPSANIDEPSVAAPQVTPRFVDVAASRGIEFVFHNDQVPDRFFLPEVMGSGFAWVDFDGDGWRDLYVLQGASLQGVVESGGDPKEAGAAGGNRLYRNVEGRFVEVSPQAGQVGHVGYGQGAAVGDFNADGFPDLYLTNYGANALLLNMGDGTFDDVTEVAGVGDRRWGTSVVWWDANGDQKLDLYICNYLELDYANNRICRFNGKPGYCGPGEFPAQDDVVYLNQGDGTFVEASDSLGMRADHGKGLAVIAADFDDDLLPEIYVANDMAPNFLFTRSPWEGSARADGAYREAATLGGAATSDIGLNEASMGIACADFDGDGRIDIFLTHFFYSKNTLYRNLGGLIFRDDSKRSRIAAHSFESLGFGAIAFDYDRDGYDDLFVTNGHVLGPNVKPNEMKAQLLVNAGGGVFDDISPYAGAYFQELWLGRAAGGCDFDNDGDLDIAVSHLHRPMALLENRTDSKGRNYLGLELRTRSRVSPTGARITLSSPRQQRAVSVTQGGSYLCAQDDRLLLGLGPHDQAVRVRVAWPDGSDEDFGELSPNRYWRLAQGSGAVTFGEVLGWPDRSEASVQ